MFQNPYQFGAIVAKDIFEKSSGAGGAYLRAQNQRENVKNTAKLMTQYGPLRPDLLRQAYPLLGDDYRIA